MGTTEDRRQRRIAVDRYYACSGNNPIRFRDPWGIDKSECTTTAKWNGLIASAGNDGVNTYTWTEFMGFDPFVFSAISNALGSPRPYNVLNKNCATFVADVLSLGGLQVPNTKFPNELMRYLKQAYGRPP